MDDLYNLLLSEVPENATEEFLKQNNLFYVFCTEKSEKKIRKKVRKEFKHTVDLFKTIIKDINKPIFKYSQGFIFIDSIKIDLDTGITSRGRIVSWREKKFVLLNMLREFHFRVCVEKGLLLNYIRKGKQPWPIINVKDVVMNLI